MFTENNTKTVFSGKGKKLKDLRTGYNKIDKVLSRSIDVVLVMLMMPANLLVLGIIYIASLIFHHDGGPFFYSGARLGQHKEEFTMYKVRTLAINSEQQIGSDLLVPGSGRELFLGRFLRTTRLDELPQLFNILKGDMTFVGPRPMRQAVYEKVREGIPNYDLRFSVRPGLLGYSQIFTPHSTPKRIRSLIDNKFINVKSKFVLDILLIAITISMVSLTIFREVMLGIKDLLGILRNRPANRKQRKMRRISGNRIEAHLTDAKHKQLPSTNCVVYDINYEAICLICDTQLPVGEIVHFSLIAKRHNKTKKIDCQGRVKWERKLSQNQTASDYSYVIFFESLTRLNRYKIDNYILDQSIASIITQFQPRSR